MAGDPPRLEGSGQGRLGRGALEERQKQSESGFYITFKADGTGAFYAEDLEYQGSWKSSGDAVTFPLVLEQCHSDW